MSAADYLGGLQDGNEAMMDKVIEVVNCKIENPRKPMCYHSGLRWEDKTLRDILFELEEM